MKILAPITVAIILGIGLIACGGGGSSSTTPTPTPTPTPTATSLTITGSAIKGTFDDALVEVFQIDNLSLALASARSDSMGSYSLTITDSVGNPINGYFLVKVSVDANTSMICDAVVCGSVDRAGVTPSADIMGIELSTLVYTTGNNVSNANVNVITSLATETLLASVAANFNIDFASMSQPYFVGLQERASLVIGDLFGLNLDSTNVFTAGILDASVSANLPNNNATLASLSLTNAAFSGISADTSSNETLGITISSYMDEVKSLVAFLAADSLASIPAETQVKLADVQIQISSIVDNIHSAVNSETNSTIDINQLPASVDLANMSNSMANVIEGYKGVTDNLITGSNAISSAGLVASYDFESYTNGGLLRDFSSSANDGIVTTTNEAEGLFGTARDFTLLTDMVDLPESESFSLEGNFTIATWINVTRLGLHQHVFSCDDMFVLWMTESNQYRLADTQGNGITTTAGTVTSDEWHSVVGVFSGSRGDSLTTDNIKIFIDGVQSPGTLENAWSPASLRETDACFIGGTRSGDAAHQALQLEAIVDELQVYSRPLSEEEIRIHATRKP